MAAITRVRCRVCENEEDSYCTIKKCKIRGNKSRICVSFRMNSSKVRIKTKIPSQFRPDWYWDRKEYKKVMKEARLKAEQAQVEQVPSYLGTKAPDCLADFRSTAGEK